MSLSQLRRNQAIPARQVFYTLLGGALIGLIGGPLSIFQGIDANNRERPSLQWPKTSGTMTQCDIIRTGGHPGEKIAATYTYVVNNERYTGHQVTLYGYYDAMKIDGFAYSHPASSAVDVYYDPQNPGNAVLVPGADESLNQFKIKCGYMVIALAVVIAFLLPARYAQMQQEKAVSSL